MWLLEVVSIGNPILAVLVAVGCWTGGALLLDESARRRRARRDWKAPGS